MLGEQRIQLLRLRAGARIAVEDRAGIGRHGGQLVVDQRGDDIVGDELARIHDRLGLLADGRARLDRCAQHVMIDEPVRLRSLACTRRPQKNDVHDACVPSPRSISAGGLEAAGALAQPPLQLRLLDKVAILVCQQV